MPTVDFVQLMGNPSPKSVVSYGIAILASLVFALVFHQIYRIYSARGSTGIEINKSFIPIAPAVTAIFLVIQFSLPLSLGLLGALSFVRFRTPVKEPEDIGFILIVIASSLSCAVFRFEVSLILAAVLLVVALIRSHSQGAFQFLNGKRHCELFVTTSKDNANKDKVLSQITGKLSELSLKNKILSISNTEGLISYHLRVQEKTARQSRLEELVAQLKQIQNVSNVNLILSDAT